MKSFNLYTGTDENVNLNTKILLRLGYFVILVTGSFNYKSKE